MKARNFCAFSCSFSSFFSQASITFATTKQQQRSKDFTFITKFMTGMYETDSREGDGEERGKGGGGEESEERRRKR